MRSAKALCDDNKVNKNYYKLDYLRDSAVVQRSLHIRGVTSSNLDKVQYPTYVAWGLSHPFLGLRKIKGLCYC